MGGLFSKQSSPPPVVVAAPPAPTPMPDPGSVLAAEEARKRARAAMVGGREATILGRAAGGDAKVTAPLGGGTGKLGG
jgi:hypothetical protein